MQDVMEKPEDTITEYRLLRWLATTVLVFVLITFSGYVPQPGFLSYQPIKTEIAESRKQPSRKTVYFKKAFYELNRPPQDAGFPARDFSFFLIHQENTITLKLKNNLNTLPPTTAEEGFLVHYSTDEAEGFDENHLRG